MKKFTLWVLVVAIAAAVSGQVWAADEAQNKAGERIKRLEAQCSLVKKELRAAQEKAGILKDKAVVELSAKLETAQKGYDARVAELTAANPTTAEIQKNVTELEARPKPDNEELASQVEVQKQSLKDQLYAAQKAAGILEDGTVVTLAAELKKAQKDYDNMVIQLSTANPATAEIMAKAMDLDNALQSMRDEMKKQPVPKE